MRKMEVANPKDAFDLLAVGVDDEPLKTQEQKRAEVLERQQTKQEAQMNVGAILKIPEVVRDSCVKAKLVPQEYRNCEFSQKMVESNYKKMAKVRSLEVKNKDAYIEALNGILTQLRARQKLDRSYIIGAPNGFGKTSFANTGIMLAYFQGMRVVQYISLSELMELKVANDTRLLGGYSLKTIWGSDGISYHSALDDEEDYVKKPEIITGHYHWSEYMEADILFTYLTEPSFKEVESAALKAVLAIRGAKGLPTIVMTSTSLGPYTNHEKLGEYLWKEMLDYGSTRRSYDRIKHISCYNIKTGK